MLKLSELSSADREWLLGEMAKVEEGDEDNFRLARVGNSAEEAEYENTASEGCCGSADFVFEGSPSGTSYRFGFNYGH